MSKSLADRFVKFDDEYCEFDRIPDEGKFSRNDFSCALIAIEKWELIDKNADFDVVAEHDIIYLPDLSEDITDAVSDTTPVLNVHTTQHKEKHGRRKDKNSKTL